MSRTIDSAILATLNDAYLGPVMFTSLAFPDGTLSLHTDLGDIFTLPGETWNFTNTADSWSGVSLTLTNNPAFLRLTATAADHNFVRTVSFDGSAYRTVRARVMRKAGPSGGTSQLFYSTSGHGSSPSFVKDITDTTVTDAWVILEWDMENLSVGGTDWITNTITALRIDFSQSATDIIDVDWIQVVPRWIGTGDLGGIDPIEERGDQSPTGTILRLSGIDATLLNEALAQNYYDRSVKIYFSVRDATSGDLVAEPSEIFAGRMDQMRVLSGVPTATIELAVESELIEFDKSPLRYFSDSQLQKDYAGDLGFEYLAAMKNLRITVGSKNTIQLGNHAGSISIVPQAPHFHL